MMYPAFNYDEKRSIDLICMGRVAVDLYAEQIGSELRDATSFKKYLGGCAGNIAVGTARLGLKTQIFSCVGLDEMGAFLRQELQKEGVNTDLLYTSAQHLTGLVLLGIKPPHEFPLIFYRNQCADMQLQAQQINASHLQQAKALLITGTGLSTAEMRATTHAVVELARASETLVILDLDFRPVLWGLTALGDGETRFRVAPEVTAVYQELIPYCDLIVGTEEELRIAAGVAEIDTSIAHLRKLTAAPIVVKLGEKGAMVSFSKQPVLKTQTFPVEVLNVLGAGDAFMAGLLSGLLQAKAWEEATTRANAAGALVVTRHGCAPAIPFAEELDYFIQQFAVDPLVWQSPYLAALHERQQKDFSQPLLKNPLGFAQGLQPIVQMQTSPYMGMNFSALKLVKGQRHAFNPAFEFAVLLMTGRVIFNFAKQQQQVERSDYFAQEPIVLHCAAGETASVQALTDCELLIIETENSASFTPLLFNADNLLEVDHRGKGLLEDSSYRLVRTVFDKRNRPESNLVLGEIITFQGRWSSYPSHHHEQPEIYHYRFSEPQGFAFAEQGKNVLRVEHYDTLQIAKGLQHAHCTAPGYALYTLWFIRHLPGNPYLQPTFDKEHAWTRNASANQRVWS
ncbi:MAG: 5-dehydro-2-deoxygluconokinase [Legionella sp.]|nr:MAG: 5-dehydro-2-deoxygluconokinase [Legionella sp.]